MSPQPTCRVAGCRDQITATSRTGMCEVHRWRTRVLGSTEAPSRSRLHEWLMTRAEPQPNGCITWLGRLDEKGYGRVYMEGTNRKVHRVSYEATKGEIPVDLELDHLCRNRACLNPDHLEAVTHQENTRRAAAYITHCPQGHEYTEANTVMKRPNPGFPKARRCRTCRKAEREKSRQKQAAMNSLREAS